MNELLAILKRLYKEAKGLPEVKHGPPPEFATLNWPPDFVRLLERTAAIMGDESDREKLIEVGRWLEKEDCPDVPDSLRTMITRAFWDKDSGVSIEDVMG